MVQWYMRLGGHGFFFFKEEGIVEMCKSTYNMYILHCCMFSSFLDCPSVLNEKRKMINFGCTNNF